MRSERRKLFNLLAGLILLLLGIACYGGAGYYILVPSPPIPTPILPLPATDNESCRTALMGLGYIVSYEGAEIKAYQQSLDNPREELDQASAAIVGCGLRLKSFCMGTSCSRQGLQFSLEADQRDPHAKPVPKASAAKASVKASLKAALKPALKTAHKK